MSGIPLLLQSFLHVMMFFVFGEVSLMMTGVTLLFGLVFATVLLQQSYLTSLSTSANGELINVTDHMAFGRKHERISRKISKLRKVEEIQTPGRRSSLTHSRIAMFFADEDMPLTLSVNATDLDDYIQ